MKGPFSPSKTKFTKYKPSKAQYNVVQAGKTR